jgi:hypothetical protein
MQKLTLTLAALAVVASTTVACAQNALFELFTPAETLAKEDDTYCKSIGARGSDYTTCRMFMTKQRADRRRALADGFADGLSRAGESFQRNQSTNCTTSGPYAYRTTTCY